MDSIALHPLGQDAIVIQCALRVDDKVIAQVQDIKARLEEHVIDGVVEIVPALTSVLVRFDPMLVSRDRVLEFIQPHCDEASLRDATVPTLSRLWTIPVCVTGPAAPDLAEVSSLTGMSEQALIEDVLTTSLRVLAIGFAPGQPYIGMLPKSWDFARKPELTEQVPAGALVTAVRQLVLFANSSPTGWRQIGQCAFRPFDPTSSNPIPLRAGDGIAFRQIGYEDMQSLIRASDPLGGAQCQDL